MKLYFTPGVCSLAVHIVLNELGLPHTLERVDLGTHKTASGADYHGINPKGYVPALQLDDGTVLTEVPAITQYLADQKPEAGLIAPAGSIERARITEWLAYTGAEIHKRFSPLFRGGSEQEQAQAREMLTTRFAYADKVLAERDYLTGAQMTVADCYLFVVCRWAEKKEIPLGDGLRDFMRRMNERPAVLKTLREEGLA